MNSTIKANFFGIPDGGGGRTYVDYREVNTYSISGAVELHGVVIDSSNEKMYLSDNSSNVLRKYDLATMTEEDTYDVGDNGGAGGHRQLMLIGTTLYVFINNAYLFSIDTTTFNSHSSTASIFTQVSSGVSDGTYIYAVRS